MRWPLMSADRNEDAVNGVPGPALFAAGAAAALALHRAQRLPARPRRLFRALGGWMLALGAVLFGWAVYT
ncbi:MAG: hypothetical protein OXI25_00065, partial [Chloroflexota bacterium]|nr:hypothetical protein [Chloroflexota bacterium]